MCSEFSIFLTTYFTFGFLLTRCLPSAVYSYICFVRTTFCLALSPVWCSIMFPFISVIMCSKFSIFLTTYFTFSFLLARCLASSMFYFFCPFCTIFYHTFFPMCIFIVLPRNIKKMFTLYDKCYISISLCGNSNLIIFWKCSFYCNCSVFYIDYTFRHRNCLLILFNSCDIEHPLRCFFQIIGKTTFFLCIIYLKTFYRFWWFYITLCFYKHCWSNNQCCEKYTK